MSTRPLRPRVRDAIIQSLQAGVVPRVGQAHIQVGRVQEVKALISDIERIADDGSGARFVIGEYGSGKTFFLNLIRSIAMEKKLVTVHADLNPDRRIHATGGQARSLYQELMRNMATRSKPEGGALFSVVERFVSQSLQQARERNVKPDAVIHERLQGLTDLVGGYDFAEVIAAYWRGHDSGDELLKSNAVRWLRGEFSTKTDAKKALGVRTIVDDSNVYDQLKLLAKFTRLAGYEGLMVCLDECVNLYKLSNSRARNSNYEQILRILNDCLQGSAESLGFLFGGTPEFLMDNRRGLYSYEALQSRLAENTFAVGDLVDFSGPVIRISNLSPEDLYVLLVKLRDIFLQGVDSNLEVPNEAIEAFMHHCSTTIGDAYFCTPRNTISSFLDLLAVLDQNPSAKWSDHVKHVQLKSETNPDFAEIEESEDSDGELASFKL